MATPTSRSLSLGRIALHNLKCRISTSVSPFTSTRISKSQLYAGSAFTFSCRPLSSSRSFAIVPSTPAFGQQSRGLQAWVHSLWQKPTQANVGEAIEGTEDTDTDTDTTEAVEAKVAQDVVAIKKMHIMDLRNDVFGAPPRLDILHRVVVWQRREWWQGTAKAKGRAEVRGGGRKPWKQKGTGRARTSSIRNPIFKGGGVVHGPKVRDHSIKLPNKVHQMGIRVALSVKYAQGDLTILEDLELPNGKTKTLYKALQENKSDFSSLFVDCGEPCKNFELATRNLPQCDLISFEDLSVYQVLLRHKLFLTRSAVAALEEKFKIEEKYIVGVNVPQQSEAPQSESLADDVAQA